MGHAEIFLDQEEPHMGYDEMVAAVGLISATHARNGKARPPMPVSRHFWVVQAPSKANEWLVVDRRTGEEVAPGTSWLYQADAADECWRREAALPDTLRYSHGISWVDAWGQGV